MTEMTIDIDVCQNRLKPITSPVPLWVKKLLLGFATTTELTKKLPKAELKMAAASFPPTALVSMTADETGGGMQPTTCNLKEGMGTHVTKYI